MRFPFTYFPLGLVYHQVNSNSINIRTSSLKSRTDSRKFRCACANSREQSRSWLEYKSAHAPWAKTRTRARARPRARLFARPRATPRAAHGRGRVPARLSFICPTDEWQGVTIATRCIHLTTFIRAAIRAASGIEETENRRTGIST